jgi:signal transduction histidine kinase
MIRSKWRRAGLWCVFTILWTVVFAAALLISRSLLQLEQAEREARHAAAVEENLRLALWRLDSILGPLLAQQSVVPIPWTAEDPIANESTSPTSSSTLVSLPVRTPFRLELDGQVMQTESAELQQSAKILSRLREFSRFRSLALPELTIDEGMESQIANAPSSQQNRSRATSELTQRAQNLERANANVINNSFAMAGVPGMSMPGMGMSGIGMPGTLQPQPFTAFWENDKLLLARQIAPTENAIEGWEIDWPRLEQEMKQQIVDLLPNAEFAAVKDVATQSSPDMLVSIPCLLQPGTVAGNFQDTVSSKVLPLPHIFLALWLGVITAAVATGVLLGGALRLSDRRAAFVAAVTHELRTPLTTLQLYSEMLGSNMIQAEETKQSYLQTLQNEVQRIVHLVENVFAYARLEKGRRPRSLERLSVTDVMARSSIRLQKLAERAEMELVLEPCEAWEAEVLGDPSMIEQILVNLVDNAGKYAKDASDRRIFIRAEQKGTRLHISVEDRGGGFDKLKRRQSPFSKTVQQAAESAPGIGLGLAISQRFAHELGGKLLLENIAGGARVTLVLPIVE